MPELEAPVQKENPGIYTFWPRETTQPRANLSAGENLKELGNIIPKAAQLGVDIEHTEIGGDVDRGVDAIRDNYTGRLQTLYSNLKDTDPSLFGEETGKGAQAPADLNRRMKAFDALDAAKASGKYSETYLYGQYVNLAKDLRSKYSNMRDYVDERVDRSTGRGIANRYVAGLISDINSFTNQRDEFVKNTDRELNRMVVEGNRDLLPVYQARVSGQITAQQAAVKMNDINAQDYDLKRRKAIREDITGDISMKKDMAQGELSTYLSNRVTNYVNNHEALIQRLSDPNVSDTDKEGIANLILSQGEAIKRDAITWAQKNGVATVLGDDWMKGIDSGLSYFKSTAESLKSNETSPAQFNARVVKARQHDFNKALFDSDMGADFMMNTAVKEAGGGPGSKMEAKLSEIERAQGLDTRMSTFLTNQANILLFTNLGASGMLDPNKTPVKQEPLTFGDSLSDTKSRLDKAGVTSPAIRSSIFDGLLKYFDLFTEKGINKPIKDSIEKAAFDKPWLSKIDPDTSTKLGSSKYFAVFTSPKVDKEIFTNYPKDVQEKYVNWKTSEFAHTVFRREINTIDRLSADSSDLTHVGKFGYNTITHRIVFEPNVGQGKFYVGSTGTFITPQQKEVQAAVDRLNMGLDNMANLAGYTGVDPNTYILRAMKEGGLKQGPVLQQINDAVHHSLVEEDRKALNQ